jgi:hypothetical protein
MHAIDDDRAFWGQFPAPVFGVVGIAPDRTGDHLVIRSKRRIAANVDDDGRTGDAERPVQVERGNRRGGLAVHARAPRVSEVAQSLDGASV